MKESESRRFERTLLHFVLRALGPPDDELRFSLAFSTCRSAGRRMSIRDDV